MNPNKIALEHCNALLELARRVFEKNPLLSKRYVSLARRIAMRHRISLGNKFFCKKCGTIFIPGKTLKIRVGKNRVLVYMCMQCSSIRRFGFSKKTRPGKKLFKQ